MGKRGGGGTTTSYTSSVPKYLQPYLEDLVARAEEESMVDYAPFEGERIATVGDPEIRQARQMIEQAVPRGQQAIRSAREQITGQAGFGSQLMGFAPTTGFSAAGTFDADTAASYMSPYMQAVVEAQKRGVKGEFAKQQAERAAQAAQAGAFGGSRFAIMESEADAALSQQLADIEAKGLQEAYEQGLGAFQADREATFAREQAGTQAAVQGSDITGQSAQAIQNLVGSEAGLAAMIESIGLDKLAREQRSLDLAYEDFLRQRDKPREDIQFLSSVIQGVPAPSSQEITKYSQADPAGQILGGGIAAYALDQYRRS